MTLETWLTFLVASTVLTMTPGPSVLLGMVHSLNYGIKRTFFTALGDITANFIQMILVAIGLGIVIASSEVAFQVIKWMGVVTLLYIGVKLFVSQPEYQVQSEDHCNVSAKKMFWQGFMVAAGNPKAIVFFTAFFPQFMDASKPLLPQMAIMCPTMALLDFSFVMLYAYFAKQASRKISRHPHVLSRFGGGALMGAAGLLALSSNR